MPYRTAQPPDGRLPPNPCPDCRIEMYREMVDAVPVLRCERCHGCWADAAHLETLMAVMQLRREALGPNPRTSEGRRCPTCHAHLERRPFHVRDLDVCYDHGAWFDRDETRVLTKT